ncbi:MAG TPA: glycoside hydrolase family 15 protein [Noviherbaspirillum sp.]|nr:glycoside hydrolase family 15 protein [Noviherbaspirillum sp.]
MSEHYSYYPKISDYALISDCHCNALISRNGSVDWCCMPRVDDDSIFGRLLDWKKGGYCSIAPEGDFKTSWRYLPETLVLETTFHTATGMARLIDFFAIDPDVDAEPLYDHVRIVQGIEGEVKLRVEVRPRFDYGEILPRMRRAGRSVYTAIGSDKGLIIHADMELEVAEHDGLYGSATIRAGERLRLALEFETPERVEQRLEEGMASANELDGYFETTRNWWRKWASRMDRRYASDPYTMRSALVLKGLTFERTGAIIAATTTSLPEWIGGERNWDYRYSWVRDSVFTVRVLHDLGYVREADLFHQFIQRSAAGSAEQMQIMYGVDGKRRLTETILDWMEGYRGSKPVRIGNCAAKQVQLDIYGELLEMAWEWHANGHPTEPDYWTFLRDVVETACRRWRDADHGIWEVRDVPRHYVHSKVMCWAAVNRGICLAEDNGFEAPLERWRAVREEMRTAIETEGYDATRNTFVQAFGEPGLDAAVLLLPRVGFLPYDDPRMMGTVDAICQELDEGGLLLRYNTEDGLEGEEGMFLPCTFWLVACLAQQGRRDRAEKYYRRALECANDIGLFSEEYSIRHEEMLGNFPQGLTHVSQIMAHLALEGNGQGA